MSSMSELKTKPSKQSVSKFIDSIKDERKKEWAKVFLKMFKDITKKKPEMWGNSGIIGFGRYKYHRKGNKEEHEWFNVGFAPRKDKITIYLTCYLEKEKELLKKLGKFKHGAGCLYINKLEDIDLKVLRKMVEKNKNNQWYS
jgi:hypothetical protein